MTREEQLRKARWWRTRAEAKLEEVARAIVGIGRLRAVTKEDVARNARRHTRWTRKVARAIERVEQIERELATERAAAAAAPPITELAGEGGVAW